MKTKRLLLVSMLLSVVALSTVNAATSTNLANLYGSILGSSGSERNEPPAKIIDGKYEKGIAASEKWCKNPGINPMTHWVVIDLGIESSIESFTIYDGAWNEAGVENFANYTIYVSSDINTSNVNDAAIWTEDKKVVSEEGREADDQKIAILPTPVMGRYVKLEIPNFGVLRIWEFQIFGKRIVNPNLLSVRFGSIHSRSGAFNDNEEARLLIDGNSGTKWCAGGNNHWAIIDLGAECDLDSIAIYDCKTKEPNEKNLGSYKLYVGYDVNEADKTLLDADGRVIDPILDVTVEEDRNIKEHKISAKGRYVKFVPVNSDFSTIRIYELEIWGEGPKITIDKIDNKQLVDGEELPVSISYFLEGDKDNFNFELLSDNPLIVISDVEESSSYDGEEVNGNINFKLSCANEAIFAVADVTLRITNGGEELPRAFKAKAVTTNPSPELYANVALTKKAGSWDYPNRINNQDNQWAWNEDTGGLLTDGDLSTAYVINKNALDIILNLEEQYIVPGIQMAYQAGRNNFQGFGVTVSPIIDAGSGDEEEAGYVLQSDKFPGGVERVEKVMALDGNVLAGTIKLKGMVDWGNAGDLKMNLFEIYAYCEKPVIDQLQEIVVEEGASKLVEAAFELKGFAHVSRENIQLTVEPVDQDQTAIEIRDAEINYITGKISFTIVAGNEVTTVPVSLRLSLNGVDISQNFSVKVDVPVGTRHEFTTPRIWPNPVRQGEILSIETKGANQVRLYNAQGVLVAKNEVKADITMLSLENIPTGIYFLQVLVDNNSVLTEKVVVE